MIPSLETRFGAHSVRVFTRIGGFGHVATHSSRLTRPRRHDEHTINASRCAKSNNAVRASEGLARGVVLCSTWRAAMHLSFASNLHLKFAVAPAAEQAIGARVAQRICQLRRARHAAQAHRPRLRTQSKSRARSPRRASVRAREHMTVTSL